VKGPEEILAQSVCEITENTIYNKNVPRSEAMNDRRMGTVDRRIPCGTCGHGVEKCNGHSGHIVLPVPLYNVGFMDNVLRILRSVCYFCSALLIPPQDWVVPPPDQSDVQAFEHVTAWAKTYHKCVCWSCQGAVPVYKRKGLTIERTWTGDRTDEDPFERQLKDRVFDAGLAREIMATISDDDCRKMGFHVQFTRPEYFITTVLLVPPPLIRPAIMISEGSKAKGQDDLTRKLQDVLKKCFVLQNLLKKTKALDDDKVSRAVEELQYDYAVYLNNELKGVPQDTQRSGAPIRGVAQRIKAKGGLIRNNLMGKRVDFSARTVISADPNLDVDQVGVPLCVATVLTIPVTVTPLTIQELSQRVLRGADRIDGASLIEYASGKTKKLSACPDRHLLQLPYGAKVHRYLKDDDYVIFNRHPSLHKESIMAHRVKIMAHGDTFRMNLVPTKPFNADFDVAPWNFSVAVTVLYVFRRFTTFGILSDLLFEILFVNIGGEGGLKFSGLADGLGFGSGGVEEKIAFFDSFFRWGVGGGVIGTRLDVWSCGFSLDVTDEYPSHGLVFEEFLSFVGKVNLIASADMFLRGVGYDRCVCFERVNKG